MRWPFERQVDAVEQRQLVKQPIVTLKKCKNRGTEWWMVQFRYELLSWGNFPDQLEKNREFSNFVGIWSVLTGQKRPSITGIFQRIPCRSEQGICEAD
jgi:hypothetical protein